MIYAPVQLDTVGRYESPLAQQSFYLAVQARHRGDHQAAKALKAQARAQERAFKVATRLRFNAG